MAKIPDASIYSQEGTVSATGRPRQELFEDVDDGSFADDDGALWSLLAKIAEIESRGGRVVRRKPDGKIEEISIDRCSSGFSIITMTYASLEDYEYKQRILAALEEDIK